MKVFVSGGAGFIGSAFIRLLAVEEPGVEVLNFDELTYAGNLENLEAVARHPDYRFVRGDLRDAAAVFAAVERFAPAAVVHFAAESHVDRSIHSPRPAVETNFNGTFNLLEAARLRGVARFIQVSTDEVYGSIDRPDEADEEYPLRTSSPYSAAKAAADLLALSYVSTFGLNLSVTRASNNYGPYQFPEKLIPLMICNALDDKPLPVYGDGRQVRDWLHVEDHCRAIRAVLDKGRAGEIYNVGGSRELTNIEVVRKILAATGKPESLIAHVADRPGHDRRYAVTSEKIAAETGWRPTIEFEDGLAGTVAWYRENSGWVERVRSGEYRRFMELNYADRGAAPTPA